MAQWCLLASGDSVAMAQWSSIATLGTSVPWARLRLRMLVRNLLCCSGSPLGASLLENAWLGRNLAQWGFTHLGREGRTVPKRVTSVSGGSWTAWRYSECA